MIRMSTTVVRGTTAAQLRGLTEEEQFVQREFAVHLTVTLASTSTG